MKVFSDACEYAIRAVVYLAQRPQQRLTVRQIADATDVPPGYLAKTLQTLAKANILDAHRGTQGGYTLRRSPRQLSLMDILKAVEPPHRRESCPLGPQVNGRCECPAHRYIDAAVASLEQRLGQATIARLTRDHHNHQKHPATRG